MTRFPTRLLRRLAVLAACAGVSACAASGPARPQLTYVNRLHVAEAAAAAGNAGLAATMYGEAAASDPANSKLQVTAAKAMARLGQMMPARAMLAERLKARPNDPVLLGGAARLAIDAGDTHQALRIYDRMLASHPGDVDAKVDKAVALDLIGQHPQAQQLYREALKVRARDPVISNDLAMSLMLQGHVHQATAVLAPVANAANSPGRARDNLGLLYALDGNKARSRALIGNRLTDGEVARIAQAVGGNALISAPPVPLAMTPSASIPVAEATMAPLPVARGHARVASAARRRGRARAEETAMAAALPLPLPPVPPSVAPGGPVRVASAALAHEHIPGSAMALVETQPTVAGPAAGTLGTIPELPKAAASDAAVRADAAPAAAAYVAAMPLPPRLPATIVASLKAHRPYLRDERVRWHPRPAAHVVRTRQGQLRAKPVSLNTPRRAEHGRATLVARWQPKPAARAAVRADRDRPVRQAALVLSVRPPDSLVGNG